MRRTLFNFAAAVSLVLCVAAVGLQISQWRTEHLLVWGANPRCSFGVNGRAFTLTRDTAVSDKSIESMLARLHSLLGYATTNRNDYVLGGSGGWARAYGPIYVVVGEQKLIHDRPDSDWTAYSLPFGKWWQVSVPYWLLVVLPLPLPLLAATRIHRQRMRRIRGECRLCGYSLTGNTSSICPECGTAIAKAGVEQ